MDDCIYKIEPALEVSDETFREMLYHAIHVPSGEQSPSRNIVFHPELARYVEKWGRPGDIGYVAVTDDGPVVGAAWSRLFTEDSPGYGFISEGIPEISIVVLPDWQGKGIGTRLLKALLHDLEKACISVSLSVSGSNPARRLYERFGFQNIHNRDSENLIMRLDFINNGI